MKLLTGRKKVALKSHQVEVLPPARPETVTTKITVSAQHVRCLLENEHLWDDVKMAEVPTIIRFFAQIESDILILRKKHFGSQR